MYKGISVLFIMSIGWFLMDLYNKYKYKIRRYKCTPKNGFCKNYMCKHAKDCYYCNYNDCIVYDLDDTQFVFYLPEQEREYRKAMKKSLKIYCKDFGEGQTLKALKKLK